MKLIKNTSLLILIFCTLYLNTWAQNQVILSVEIGRQEPAYGYNFCSEINQIIRPLILKNSLPFYTDITKTIPLSGEVLSKLEETNGVSFLRSNLYLFETWTSKGKETFTKTVGISFYAIDSIGDLVSFGYVDLSSITNLLANISLTTQADGYYPVTALVGLEHKLFTYQIENFNGKPLRSTKKREKLKRAFINPKTLKSTQPLSTEKLIRYHIPKEDSVSEKNTALYLAINDFFATNPQEALNLLAITNNQVSVKQIAKWKVKSLSVYDMWKNDQELIQKPILLRVEFDNGMVADSINLSYFKTQEISIDNYPLTEFLALKQFNYHITTINFQQISAEQAPNFKRALFEADWTEINKFVRLENSDTYEQN